MSKMMQSEQIAAFCSLIASIQRHYGLWRLREVSGAKMEMLSVLNEMVALILMLEAWSQPFVVWLDLMSYKLLFLLHKHYPVFSHMDEVYAKITFEISYYVNLLFLFLIGPESI